MSIFPLRGDEWEIRVENPADLVEALDLLHSSVLDHWPGAEEGAARDYLAVLERAMDEVENLRDLYQARTTGGAHPSAPGQR